MTTFLPHRPISVSVVGSSVLIAGLLAIASAVFIYPKSVSADISPKGIAPTAILVSDVIPVKPHARLRIPQIGVDAVIEDMGLTSTGAMAVPNNTVDVGWYSLGTRPGEIGSAVIGGHNNWGGMVGVFYRLDQLKVGDVFSVLGTNGVSTSFVIRQIRTYLASDTGTEIFTTPSGVHLNLITCSGVWDPEIKTYTNRLVIFADAE